MSWLARSFAHTLRLQEDGHDHHEPGTADNFVPRSAAAGYSSPPEDWPPDSTLLDLRLSESETAASEDEDPGGNNIQGRGVKEDLSEFRDSLARQLWGVASFLAPPPPPPLPPPLGQRSDLLPLESESGSDRTASDADEELVGYGSRLPGQSAEPGDLSPSDGYYSSVVDEAVGITDEVLAFARNIAHHPETWLDFPLSEDEDFDDFDISDDQYKHALAVEHLAPRLSALRIEFCPAHMSVGYFWMVYFVLLHSRLNKHDAVALSSPQLVTARAMWMQALQKQTKESYGLGASSFHLKEHLISLHEDFTPHSSEGAHSGNQSEQLPPFEHSSSIQEQSLEHEIEKHPINEIEFVDKSVIREDPAPELQDKEMITGSSSKTPVAEDIDDDDWLKEDSDLIGYSSHSIMVNEEDISFSDLEDDCATLVKYKTKDPQSNEKTI